ncbi:MAG TPA: hypothetical protein VFU93_05290 [Acidimicrobiales bacterium]|nr:hypothetical protein [Acidimicrobiales bacterium]
MTSPSPTNELLPSQPSAIARFVRVVAGACAVGLVVGGVIAGVGGRLAMRLLAVTSDDRLRGRVTDDDEVVGEITAGGTIGFIIFMALSGAALALFYVVLRRWLPAQARWRALAFAGLFWAVQGQDIFESDGFDFRELSPRWLAVLLFTAIMIAVGWLTVLGVDDALARWPLPSPRSWASVLPLVPMILFFPILIGAALVGLLALAIERVQVLSTVWRSRAMTAVGVGLLVVTALINGGSALREVAKILA